MTTTTDTLDYKDTLFLPRTDFPMRGGLPAARARLARPLGAAAHL